MTVNITLKKILALLGLLPLLLLTSCHTDYITDHGVYEEAAPVAGTYLLTVMQTNDPSNLNDRSSSSINLVDELQCLAVTLVLNEDGSLESTYTELEMVKDAEGNYQFGCGPQGTSTGSWDRDGMGLTIDGTTFLVKGNQLIDARNREAELIDLVVFTKQD